LLGLRQLGAKGEIGARRPKMQPLDIEAAEAMLADPNLRVSTIAGRFGVSVPTFYRYVPAARLRTGIRFERSQRVSPAVTGNAYSGGQ
jgi:Helix-turn-helix domain of resolvase